MDILRKELNEIYAAQNLEASSLPADELQMHKQMADILVRLNNACAVITDASCDRSYIFSGSLAELMGFAKAKGTVQEVLSSDEDEIYNRIHPEHLVDKRLLEYEFFKYVDALPPDEKLNFKAVCHLKIKDNRGNYRYIDNSTQVLHLSPDGKIWLILCCYDLSADQDEHYGINPRIINNSSGEVKELSFVTKRKNILSEREKEILRLIQDGKPSKQIAGLLEISIHTVNRHRQNIISKLSVGNSIEAITAAKSMKLL